MLSFPNSFKMKSCFPRSALLRLHDDLQSLGGSMEKSFEKFAEFVTELKLDHKDGQLKSEQLTKLLVYNYI